MATKTTVAEAKRPSELEKAFQEYAPQIKMALPEHVPIAKFQRVVLTSINQNPDLAKADRRSLFTSCVACAQDGLYPDGKEAALVIFNTKVNQGGKDVWIQKVQYMPMVAGIRKMMRNSGEVKSAVARVVYDADDFDYVYGDEEYITHRPALAGDRGDIKFAYAIIKLENGEIIREVMDRAEIDQVRKVSKAATTGPWVGWYGEMARKTVLRRAAKSAPTSADLERVFERDDQLLGDDPMPAAALRDVTPPRPMPEDFDPASAGHTDPAEQYKQVAGDVVTEDGEIIEPEPAKAEPKAEPAKAEPEPAKAANDAKWFDFHADAIAQLENATAHEAGAWEKKNRAKISGLQKHNADLAAELVDVLNKRISQ